jgi:hypothetical protein
VIRVVPDNAYFAEDFEGHSLPKVLNGKYLKCYYPSMWQRPIMEIIVSRWTGGAKKQGRLM